MLNNGKKSFIIFIVFVSLFIIKQFYENIF